MVDEKDKEGSESSEQTPPTEEFPEGWQEDEAANPENEEGKSIAASADEESIENLEAPTQSDDGLVVNKIPPPEPPEHIDQTDAPEIVTAPEDSSAEELAAQAEPSVVAEEPLEQNLQREQMAQDMGFTIPPVESESSSGGGKVIGLGLVGFIVLLFAAYSAAWFYYADSIKERVVTIVSSGFSGEEKVKWNVAGVDVSGYPLAYDITLSGISLTSERSGKTLEGSVNAPVHINWPLFDNKVTITSKDLVTSMTLTSDDASIPTNVLFKSDGYNTHLTLTEPLFMTLLQGEDSAEFERVHAEDSNFTLHVDDELVFKYSASMIDYMARQENNRHQYELAFSVDDIDTSEHYYDMLKAFGANQAAIENEYFSTLSEEEQQSSGISIAFKASADASLPVEEWSANDDTVDMTINIEQLAFANKFIGINMDAEIHREPGVKLPHGWARLRLANYQGMFDTLTNIINAGVANFSQHMSTLSGTKVKAKAIPVDLLADSAKILASEDDGENLTILARVEKGGESYIADMPAALALGKVSLVYVQKEMARQQAEMKKAAQEAEVDDSEALPEDNDAAVSVTVSPNTDQVSAEELQQEEPASVEAEQELNEGPSLEGAVEVEDVPIDSAPAAKEEATKPLDVRSVNDILSE